MEKLLFLRLRRRLNYFLIIFFLTIVFCSCNQRYIMELEVNTIADKNIDLNIQTDENGYEILIDIIDNFAKAHGYHYNLDRPSCNMKNCKRWYFHEEHYISLKCTGDYTSNIVNIEMLREHALFLIEPEEFTVHKTELLNLIKNRFSDKPMKIRFCP